MAKFKTALGKVVDMSTLIAKNEKTRAVGNMKVNARGDTIDAMGRVIQPVTAKVNENYAKTVGNRSAQVQRQQGRNSPSLAAQQRMQKPASAPMIQEPLSDVERELEESLEDDIEVEKIKAKETGKK